MAKNTYIVDGVIYSEGPHHSLQVDGVVDQNATSIRLVPEYNGMILQDLVGVWVFPQCLEELEVPDSVHSIWGTFRNHKHLRKIHFYASDYTSEYLFLSSETFYGCEELCEFTMDKKREINLWDEIFYGCSKLCVCEGYLKIYGRSVFQGCSFINNLVVLAMSTYATNFKGCRRLKKMTILGKVPYKMTATFRKKLQSMEIHCRANSEWTKFANEGWNIKIIE